MDKPCVLLVDDNDATCTLVTAVLQRDFTTEICGDGNDALEKLKAGKYAAVVLDLRMPPPDGYEIMDAMLKSRPELLKRTIVVSAALSQRESQRLKSYPVADVIGKPFDVEMLLAAVKKCAGDDGMPFGNMLSSGMLLLIAEMLQRRWL
ncbi:MAG TPA: response regulator [Thermoanaerobaculia bacterium]|jgi:CheY-like chemotaxis protein|nr:response regulator [Thermoanaerobaculia bacterium]